MTMLRDKLTLAEGDLFLREMLRQVGAVAAILVTVMLLIGLVAFAVPQPGLGLRNWLVILFEMNAGLGVLPADPLRVFSAVDVAILVLVGATFLGLWPVLGRVNKISTGIAIALPFLGIVVLLATNQAGRSGVMAAGLIVAILMLKSALFKPLAYLGVIANGLLLVGDLATGESQAPGVAALVGFGYILLGTWFLLIGAQLLVCRDSFSVLSRG